MTVKQTVDKLTKLKQELKKVIIGRDDIIDSMILSLASNQHILLIGRHGEAKSYLVNQLGKATGLKCYSSQVHQETIVKDIVGLLNPVAYNKGEIDIIKTPFWNSELLYFDEILRGRSEFLDFLLEVMVERKTSKTLLGDTPLPVLSVIATTNPLTEDYNTERLDLALKDRFFAIINLDHLIEKETNMKFIKQVLENDNHEVESVNLTRNELINFSKEAKNVKIDSDIIIDIFANAQKEGFSYSTRFIKMFKEVCQTYALLEGRTNVVNEDYFVVGMLMMNNRFDNFKLEKIENCIDESLLKSAYSDTLVTIREINEIKDKGSDTVFLEKAVEVLDETKDKYPDMPKRMKEKIDELVNDVEEKVRLNMQNVTPRMMMKLDTERFKHIISQYIKHKTLETRYMDTKMYAKAKPIVRGTKYCTIDKSRKMKYLKIKFIPKIDEPESFEELETIRDMLERERLLSAI